MSEHDRTKAIPQGGRRVAPRVLPLADTVLLVDTSGSMSYRDAPGGRRLSDDDAGSGIPRRIDRVAEVLGYLLRTLRLRGLVCFGDFPIEVSLVGAVRLPEPMGSTDLAEGLRFVGRMRPAPARLVVISDGEPNHEEWALEAARALKPMVIDAHYVGPDDALTLKAFMGRLSYAGGPGGRSGHLDLGDPKLVAGEIRARIGHDR